MAMKENRKNVQATAEFDRTNKSQHTTTAVGQKLEHDFAEFMKEELGYHSTDFNVPMNGKVSERYYDCDIHAQKGGEFYNSLRNIGIFLFVLAIVSFIFEIREIQMVLDDIIVGVDPSLAGSGLLIFGLAGFVLGMIGKKNQVTHAWVECKEHKTKVKRHHVVKLKEAISDVRKVESPKWRPSEVIMVSKSGFDADAKNFADEYDITLYKRSGNSFDQLN